MTPILADSPPLWTLALIFAFFLGSVPTGQWLARGRGVDLRQVGSGNPGATNVARALGPAAGVFVAVFDAAKGALAVWLVTLAGGPPPLAALAGAAAVLGHNYSPFLGFKGGKGVATSVGTLLAIAPVTGLVSLAVALFTMWATRFVSAGSLVWAVTAPLVGLALGLPLWLLGVTLFLSALLVWRHRDNWGRLQSGTEGRLGERVATAPREVN